MAPRRSRSPIEADKSPPEAAQQRRVGDEWVWGWDPTPGIVSVWADNDGRAVVFRRIPNTGKLVREEDRFRPWLVLAQLTDLLHLGEQLKPEGAPDALATFRELDGLGSLRYLVCADDGRLLVSEVLE